MPSANSLSISGVPHLGNSSNMNNIVREPFQQNGFIRSQHHQQQQQQTISGTASHNSSLLRRSLRTASPQFLYSSKQQQLTNYNHSQQQQHHPGMQFPPAPPPMASMIPQAATQVPKTDPSNINNSYGTLLASQQLNMNPTISQTSQQQTNGNIVSCHNNTQNPNNILMSPISMPNLAIDNSYHLQSQIQMQHHQLQQQYYQLQQANNIPQQQLPIPANSTNQHHHQQQQQQANLANHQHQLTQQQQHQNPNQQTNAMQQVPMTTIMIPATAAVQIQSASVQIQQAAMQAMSNSGQPQILVFMIPYLISQPPTIPPTPDLSSLNSTSIKQSHLNSSFRQQSHHQSTAQLSQQSQVCIAQQNQSQIVLPQQQAQQQQQPNPNNRTISSLSNNVSATTSSNATVSTKTEHERFYVKANFYYQPTRNKMELAFQKGEILHVLDTLLNGHYGRQYWLATKVDSAGKDMDKGLIPDKKRAEEISLEQRAHDMNETNGQFDGASNSNGVIGAASVMRVSFLKRKAAQRSKSLCKDNWDNVVFDIGSMKFPPYERVVFRHPGFCRPVVIFGALADFAREKLLRDYPEKYSYPSGFNQSPDHPKVIRLKGILEVIDQGKHALLDITPSAVEKLNYVNLVPIVIFMKTESKSIIKEFRSRAAQSLDLEARDDDTLRRDGKSSRKLLEQSIKLEKTWSHVFTVILDLSTMGSEQWYRKLREIIEDQQSANVWMSDKKTDKKVSAASASNMNEMLFSVPTIQSATTTSGLDNGSLLSERFNEAVNITSKSTMNLLPEGGYGNTRSHLNNAYANNLAQRLARASSEPKLNGLMSDHDDEEDDDDDDDDIIKKNPFPTEYENSSSISSSNGATSHGHGSISGSNVSYHGPYIQRPIVQQPLTTNSQNLMPQQPILQSAPQSNQINYDHGSLSRNHDGIYGRNSQLTSNNGVYGNGTSNGTNNMPHDNYHLLPPMMSSNNDTDYHTTANSNTNKMNSNVIDLASNHDTRSSAFQVYNCL